MSADAGNGLSSGAVGTAPPVERTRRIAQWVGHGLFRASMLYFLVSAVGSVLNLLSRILLGRMLTVEQYGEMEAMMQVGVYVSIPISAIQIVVAREVATARGSGDVGRIGDVIWTVGRQMAIYSLVAISGLCVVAPWIRDFFHLNSVWPVLATASVVASGFLLVVVQGGLQGGHHFWQLGASALFGPLSRIGLSWALIRPGFGATGALVAHSASSCVMGLAGLAFIWKIVRNRARRVVALGEVYRSFVPVAVTLCVLAILGGVDMIIAKRFLSPSQAGDYARAVAVVRLSGILVGALMTVFFPWVASERAGGRRTGHLLVKSMVSVGVITAVTAALFSFWPRFFLSFFYREISPELEQWFGMLAWACIPGVCIGVLVQYSMACYRFRFLRVLLPAAVIYSFSLYLCRSSVPLFIGVIGAGGLIAVLLLVRSIVADAAKDAVSGSLRG